MAGREVIDWLQISGVLYVLPAHRGEEQGTYLWLEAGELREAVVAELFLPAVYPDQLDTAMGIATGSVHIADEHRMGDVQIRFGRVDEQRGVLSADGAVLSADVSFELRRHPPSGGFCPLCGSPLVVDPVSVITPPDGGLIGAPVTRCGACGEV
jgi:hypothetical protein